MKRLFILLVFLIGFTLWAPGGTRAGTLDRGVSLNPFFIAGGAYGQPSITALKYQMAVDTKVGLDERYTRVVNSYNTYTYNDCTFDTHNTGTFNTFESEVSGGTGDVVINNTYQ
jgi:hypothetical protein